MPGGRRSLALVSLVVVAACAAEPPCPDLARRDEPLVRLMAAPLPGLLGLVSRHTWLAVRGAGETRWESWEIRHDDQGPGTFRHVARLEGDQAEGVGGGPGEVVASWRGDEADRFVAFLRHEAPRYHERWTYWPWPGPNCNTFTEEMLRRGGLEADLPATAVGKDFRGAFGASLTSGGTGVQLESPVLGVKLGLREGVELHVFSLTFGVGAWPPSIKLPFGDGTFALWSEPQPDARADAPIVTAEAAPPRGSDAGAR